MFRSYVGIMIGASSFPRMRGDVPVLQGVASVVAEFSPHARGCSPGVIVRVLSVLCFPRMRGDVPV